jgi:hypothetical protein
VKYDVNLKMNAVIPTDAEDAHEAAYLTKQQGIADLKEKYPNAKITATATISKKKEAS